MGYDSPMNETTKPMQTVKIHESSTGTAWAKIPAGATFLAARPEGTVWEVSFLLNGQRKSHYIGARFTMNKAQMAALYAL